jgi:hypothetical protein
MLIALDPGKNLGVAWVSKDGKLLRHQIVTLEELQTLEVSDATIIVGDGTGSDVVQKMLRARGLKFVVINEEGTTLEARPLFFRDNPPKGLMRLLPKGLWSPPDSIDDYAAYAIALRYLGSKS